MRCKISRCHTNIAELARAIMFPMQVTNESGWTGHSNACCRRCSVLNYLINKMSDCIDILLHKFVSSLGYHLYNTYTWKSSKLNTQPIFFQKKWMHPISISFLANHIMVYIYTTCNFSIFMMTLNKVIINYKKYKYLPRLVSFD